MMLWHKSSIPFGRTRIDYFLRHSDRKKTVTIAVDPVQGVMVTVPRHADPGQVQKIILRKGAWIAGKLRAIRELNGQARTHEFVNGESFSYLGRNHRLKLVARSRGGTKVRAMRGRLEVVVDSRLSASRRIEAIRNGLCDWYREHAAKRIAERVAKLAPRLGVPPPQVLIRDQQKRWASCDRRGRLRFNWRIIMAPMSLVDYVVAHELCHLLRHDHSTAFWKLMRTVLPDYRDRQERLRRDGQGFHF